MTSSLRIINPSNMKVLVVCADWCSVCREYKVTLSDFSEVAVNWIDSQDFESLTDGLDVETFPTIVIYDDRSIFFMGAVEPNKNALITLLAAVKASLPKIHQPSLVAAINAWEKSGI